MAAPSANSAAYIITGGLGGLGLLVARHLIIPRRWWRRTASRPCVARRRRRVARGTAVAKVGVIVAARVVGTFGDGELCHV